MKLIDLLHKVATKVGKQNEQAVIEILSRADLQNIDVADDVANEMVNNLITIEAAKHNAAVKAHFTATTLIPFDEDILKAVDMLELGDEFKKEISEIKSTYERNRKLSEKTKQVIDTLKAAHKDGDSTKEVEKYVQKLNKAARDYAELKESTVPKSELEALKKQNAENQKNFILDTFLSTIDFANDSVPKEVNRMTAKSLLEMAMKKDNAELMLDESTLKLMNSTDNKLVFLNKQNVPVSFEDYANGLFADSKMLKVSGNENPNNNPHLPHIQVSGKEQNTSKFDAAMAYALGETN